MLPGTNRQEDSPVLVNDCEHPSASGGTVKGRRGRGGVDQILKIQNPSNARGVARNRTPSQSTSRQSHNDPPPLAAFASRSCTPGLPITHDERKPSLYNTSLTFMSVKENQGRCGLHTWPSTGTPAFAKKCIWDMHNASPSSTCKLLPVKLPHMLFKSDSQKAHRDA
jgi:hypothetical protein